MSSTSRGNAGARSWKISTLGRSLARKECQKPPPPADRERYDSHRFHGQGVTFKGKLIGVLAVAEARGDRMCQDALGELKMAVRAAGEHKQRIALSISVDGLRLRDERSGDCLYHHQVHKISFIAQDISDKRAFGYVFGAPDTGHQFFGVKTEKDAGQVVMAMRDLFHVVFELKKLEMERKKQRLSDDQLKRNNSTGNSFSNKSRCLSKRDMGGGGGSGSGSGTGSVSWALGRSALSESADAAAAQVDGATAASCLSLHSVAGGGGGSVGSSGVRSLDLLDLQMEIENIEQGINQMNHRLSPILVDAGTSHQHPPSAPPLPPPVGSSVEPSPRFARRTRTTSSSGSSAAGVPVLAPPPQTPASSSSVAAAGGGRAAKSRHSSASSARSVASLHYAQQQQAPLSEVDATSNSRVLNEHNVSAVFSELDPLGTGSTRPYVDRHDFFSHMKRPAVARLADNLTPSAVASSTAPTIDRQTLMRLYHSQPSAAAAASSSGFDDDFSQMNGVGLCSERTAPAPVVASSSLSSTCASPAPTTTISSGFESNFVDMTTTTTTTKAPAKLSAVAKAGEICDGTSLASADDSAAPHFSSDFSVFDFGAALAGRCPAAATGSSAQSLQTHSPPPFSPPPVPLPPPPVCRLRGAAPPASASYSRVGGEATATDDETAAPPPPPRPAAAVSLYQPPPPLPPKKLPGHVQLSAPPAPLPAVGVTSSSSSPAAGGGGARAAAGDWPPLPLPVRKPRGGDAATPQSSVVPPPVNRQAKLATATAPAAAADDVITQLQSASLSQLAERLGVPVHRLASMSVIELAGLMAAATAAPQPVSASAIAAADLCQQQQQQQSTTVMSVCSPDESPSEEFRSLSPGSSPEVSVYKSPQLVVKNAVGSSSPPAAAATAAVDASCRVGIGDQDQDLFAKFDERFPRSPESANSPVSPLSGGGGSGISSADKYDVFRQLQAELTGETCAALTLNDPPAHSSTLTQEPAAAVASYDDVGVCVAADLHADDLGGAAVCPSAERRDGDSDNNSSSLSTSDSSHNSSSSCDGAGGRRGSSPASVSSAASRHSGEPDAGDDVQAGDIKAGHAQLTSCSPAVVSATHSEHGRRDPWCLPSPSHGAAASAANDNEAIRPASDDGTNGTASDAWTAEFAVSWSGPAVSVSASTNTTAAGAVGTAVWTYCRRRVAGRPSAGDPWAAAAPASFASFEEPTSASLAAAAQAVCCDVDASVTSGHDVRQLSCIGGGVGGGDLTGLARAQLAAPATFSSFDDVAPSAVVTSTTVTSAVASSVAPPLSYAVSELHAVGAASRKATDSPVAAAVMMTSLPQRHVHADDNDDVMCDVIQADFDDPFADDEFFARVDAPVSPAAIEQQHHKKQPQQQQHDPFEADPLARHWAEEFNHNASTLAYQHQQHQQPQ